VLGMQRALWVAGSDEPVPDALPARLLISLGIGLVLLWLSQRLFNRLEGNFAQEL
jgi:ABC-2 type transport system permease protein